MSLLGARVALLARVGGKRRSQPQGAHRADGVGGRLVRHEPPPTHTLLHTEVRVQCRGRGRGWNLLEGFLGGWL